MHSSSTPRAPRIPLRRFAVVSLVAAVVATGCLPAAPPVQPPSAPAAEGTWRADAESWVRRAVPLIAGPLPGHETGGDGRVRGDQVVRSTPLEVARAVARGGDATRWSVVAANDRHATAVTAGVLTALTDQRRGSTMSEDEMVVRLHTDPSGHPATLDDGAFVDAAYASVVGRAADPGGRSYWVGRLAAGTERAVLVRTLLRSTGGRHHVIARVHEEMGISPPGSDRRDRYVALLDGTGGDVRMLRAQIATERLDPPTPVRVAFAGDSIPWNLAVGGAGVTVGPISSPVNASRFACGVLSTRAGWQFLRPATNRWAQQADGRCHLEIARMEAEADVDVAVWVTGAWEWVAYRTAAGTVLPAQRGALRNSMVAEMVRRVDGWASRGTRHVVLTEWGCVGADAPAALRSQSFRDWHGSILRRVRAERPNIVSIAATTPQMCTASGSITAEHHSARAGGTHWPDASGVRWAYVNWLAPAIADLRFD